MTYLLSGLLAIVIGLAVIGGLICLWILLVAAAEALLADPALPDDGPCRFCGSHGYCQQGCGWLDRQDTPTTTDHHARETHQ